MTPIFTSHYSLKSILNFEKSTEEAEADSIVEILKQEGLTDCYLLENTLGGDLAARNALQDAGIDLHFGFAATMEDGSKINLWAREGSAMSALRKLHTAQYYHGAVSEGLDGEEGTVEGRLSYENLKKLYDPSLIQLTIPFYDSFLFNNWFYLDKPSVPQLVFVQNPIFFVEHHGLPFDDLFREFVENYARKNNHIVEEVYSVYYKNNEDFDAYLTYRLSVGRKKFGRATLDAPNMEHMGGLFSWEDFKERNKK